MPRGGHRRGAGRPRGRLNNHTLTQRRVEEAYRAYMLEVHRELWQAQRERALGAFVLLVKTGDGYEVVTDPAARARVLARREGRGRDYWLIEARPPDVVLCKEINNRTMGVAMQPLEVSTSLSLVDPLAGLTPTGGER